MKLKSILSASTCGARVLLKLSAGGSLDRTYLGQGISKYLDARRPLVLGYHRVVENFEESARTSIPSMLVSARMLQAHLEWVLSRYRVVPLNELEAKGGSVHRGAKPLAAVTFDDGYADVFHNALPILKRLGIPAAVFVTTALVGTSRPQLHDRLYLALLRLFEALPSPVSAIEMLLSDLDIRARINGGSVRKEPEPYAGLRALVDQCSQIELLRLTDALEDRVGVDRDAEGAFLPLDLEMIRQMARSGVTIGAHTRTHAVLTLECGSKVREETAGSKQELESWLGQPVAYFAYPNGSFDPRVVRSVHEADFSLAFTTCLCRDLEHPELTIPRKVLWERSAIGLDGGFSSALMRYHASQMADFLFDCDHDHTAASRMARTEPKTELGYAPEMAVSIVSPPTRTKPKRL